MIVIKKTLKILIIAAMLLVATGMFSYLSKNQKLPESNFQIAGVALSQEDEWHYRFQVDGILEEASGPEFSSSPYWWLNSGGRMIISNGVGKTVEQDSDLSSYWRNLYNTNNPKDTDGGTHPQNIFRLLTKTKWLDTETSMRFKVDKINMSDSDNRNGSNGVLIMFRYMDSQNLYYAGVRVDGTAVIKKKKESVYYTLAQKKIFETEANYLRDTNPNMIPGQRWMDIKVDAYNDSFGNVHIKLYTDKFDSGAWQEVLETVDDGKTGGTPLNQAGLLGIRTDFMNIQFDDFIAKKIVQ